jgi:hypothetical protein
MVNLRSSFVGVEIVIRGLLVLGVCVSYAYTVHPLWLVALLGTCNTNSYSLDVGHDVIEKLL